MKRKSIQRVLIANRGEIAVRIIRSCRELGIRTIAVFSDVDRASLHVRLADEAYSLQGFTAAETYLHQKKLMEISRKSHADAIHPGYGFLSENPTFANRVESAGLRFIGPTPDAIRLLGDKTEARRLAKKLGIPILPGSLEPVANLKSAEKIADEVGFPILLKAAAGGGGKGMRIVGKKGDLPSMLKTAQSEAKSAFGDDRVYIEKYIESPRHVEIQIIADTHGHAMYLGERECSIQRRHQKIIEESPSPILDKSLRQAMGEAAVRLAQAGGYSNAGTVEFLFDESKQFYFLEMNTRLQVEHPVTELTTGMDLVKIQIIVAEGKELEVTQSDVAPRGHAIECRVYAEDPRNGFFPSTGTLDKYNVPIGPRVRVDNGFEQGNEISIYYDPLLCKVITWGPSRTEAIEAMKRSLLEFDLSGVESTIPFCLFVLNHDQFLRGDYDTSFVSKYFTPEALAGNKIEDKIAAAVVAALLQNIRTSKPRNGTNGVVKDASKWKSLRTEHYRS